MNDRTNLYMAAVAIVGLVCVALVARWAPEQFAAQGPMIGAVVIGVVTLLQKLKEGEKKAETTARAATAATEVIRHTVNSKNDALAEKIEEQTERIGYLEKALAVVHAVAAEKESVRLAEKKADEKA